MEKDLSGRRVVVTGLGMVTPLGLNVADTWSAVLAGRSGISTLEHLATDKLSCKIAATVQGFDVTPYMPAKDARKYDIFLQYGLAAAAQAFEDSGVEITEACAPRAGVVIGSGIGGLTNIEASVHTLEQQGPRRVSPFFVPGAITNMISGQVSMRYNLQGPNYAVTTACTTGTHAVGMAARNIKYGDADLMLAGGAEKASTLLGMAGFAAARALSTRNDAPEAASRPFDRDRDGFVLGDGAAVLVLEELEHARARGAKIYAEVTGFGMSSDAFHITQPPADGRGARLAMANALRDADMAPEKIGYINAHGTSTPAGDVAESVAVETLFGADASGLCISSTKSMTGHLLGAAGALEAALTVLALRAQVVPPTINLDNVDPACRLDYVPHDARDWSFEHALSNSFGFGGTNASLVFSRYR